MFEFAGVCRSAHLISSVLSYQAASGALFLCFSEVCQLFRKDCNKSVFFALRVVADQFQPATKRENHDSYNKNTHNCGNLLPGYRTLRHFCSVQIQQGWRQPQFQLKEFLKQIISFLVESVEGWQLISEEAFVHEQRAKSEQFQFVKTRSLHSPQDDTVIR